MRNRGQRRGDHWSSSSPRPGSTSTARPGRTSTQRWCTLTLAVGGTCADNDIVTLFGQWCADFSRASLLPAAGTGRREKEDLESK